MHKFSNSQYRFRLSLGAAQKLQVCKLGESHWVSVNLTMQEYKLLSILLQNRGVLVSREEIFIHVWGKGLLSQGSINQLVSSLRAQLKPFCGGESMILTFPKKGYMINDDSPDFDEPNHLSRWVYYVAAMTIIVLFGAVFIIKAEQRVLMNNEAYWMSKKTLSLGIVGTPTSKSIKLGEHLIELYKDGSQPMIILLTEFSSFVLIDCAFRYPAWERQWQFSVAMDEYKVVAEKIYAQCQMGVEYHAS